MLSKVPFYVYMFLREFTSDHGQAGTPYYIGKGKNKRAWDQRRSTKKPKNPENIVIFENNMTEDEAFAMETALILKYGRIDNNTGILRNQTNGGEGASGRIFSESHRNNLSESKRGDKSPRGMLGKHYSDESKSKSREKNIGPANPQYGRIWSESEREAHSVLLKDKCMNRNPLSEEHKSKISEKMSGENHPMYGKKQETKECPHCGLIGGRTMVRWHFDNCKEKS